MAVRLGRKRTAYLAMILCLCALIAVVFVIAAGLAPGGYSNIIYLVIPHGLLLCWMLLKYTREKNPPHRIDGLMIASLSFILWFGVVPLFKLW